MTILDFKKMSKLHGQALIKEARRNWLLTSATIWLCIVSLVYTSILLVEIIF